MRRRDFSAVLVGAAAGSALIPQPAQAQVGNEPYYPRTQGEIEAGVTPTNYAYLPGNVLRYGADQGGVADSTQAIQNAINVGWASGYHAHPWSGHGEASPVTVFPPGVYRLLGTVTVPTGMTIRGTGHPSHTTNHTRIIMDSPAGVDNRNKPIFRFHRATLNNAVLMNTAVTSSIEDLEFWYVLPGGTMSSPHGSGLQFGAYPNGGALMFDVDAADFYVVNCVFQHTPAAIRIKNVPQSTGTRGDGRTGNRGVGIIVQDCEFDASTSSHIYATDSHVDLVFKDCYFFNGMHRYERCTGSLVYQAGVWSAGAYVDAASGANTFERFVLTGADVQPPAARVPFLALNKARLVHITGNAVWAASGTSAFEITDADAGRIGDNTIDNSGYNSSPGAGIADFTAAIKMRGCRNLLVSGNNITASGGAVYNGFGILSGASTRSPQRNYINANAVTAPYNGAGFNAQNRFINVGAADILGVNYSTHVNDNGFLSRGLAAQTVTLQDGGSPPAPIAGKATLFVDSADGDLKVVFGDGAVKTLASDT